MKSNFVLSLQALESIRAKKFVSHLRRAMTVAERVGGVLFAAAFIQN
jgi:hypothetical protein